MRILVTGADGFIGNHVVNCLISLGHSVIATSHSLENARKKNWFNMVQYYECDLNRENDNYYKYFNEPERMIHLSWEGLPNYGELFHFERNLFSNYAFIKNMVTNGLKSFSVIGTCLEYGLQEGCLREELPVNPIVPYALAKDVLRRFIEQLNIKYSFDYRWIRLFYMYGAGQSKQSILEQLKDALANNDERFNMSGGEQLRDYLPVEKVAEYIVAITLQDKIDGIINCCSGSPISIRNLVEHYIKQSKKNIVLNLGYYPYPAYEPLAFWGDNSKLNSVLDTKE